MNFIKVAKCILPVDFLIRFEYFFNDYSVVTVQSHSAFRLFIKIFVGKSSMRSIPFDWNIIFHKPVTLISIRI